MILLNRTYAGYAAGTVVSLSTQEESALVAQGFASTSAGPVTAGFVSTTKTSGRCGIAAGVSICVITNAQFDANSKYAMNLINSDATATFITRIVPAAGQVSIVLNAAATAQVSVDWTLLNSTGGLLPPI